MTMEEAIKLIEHISITFVPTDQYGDYDDPQPYEEALDMAIEALSEPKTGWIPVSEALPSKGQVVLDIDDKETWGDKGTWDVDKQRGW